MVTMAVEVFVAFVPWAHIVMVSAVWISPVSPSVRIRSVEMMAVGGAVAGAHPERSVAKGPASM